jgi:hypothetical protein
MAIIVDGELLLEGAPVDAIAALNGRIWSKVVATDDELRSLESQFHILSTYLIGGQHAIRIYSETDPGNGFRPAESGLEDVYFLQLSQRGKQPLLN